jgi:hypothetical protein
MYYRGWDNEQISIKDGISNLYCKNKLNSFVNHGVPLVKYP